MSHLKRQRVPKSWPIPRKGTAYVVGSKVGDKGIPLLVALRDIIKVANNRKEVKTALHEKNILLNRKPVREDKQVVSLFDVITIIPSKMNYRMDLDEKGKFVFREIKESEANNKISKIVDKTLLKGKKIQVNLLDGRNILSDEKCKTNDSIIFDLNEGKINKVIELKEGSKVLVFHGKHSGERGKVLKVNKDENVLEVETKAGKVSVLIKQAIIIE